MGTYGSSNFPLDLTFQLHKGTLFCQATGQQEFPLSPLSKTKFEFLPAGLTIEFIPKQEKLIFNQNGMQAELNRKN